MFGTDADDEKPYNAFTTLKADDNARTNVSNLLLSLLDFAEPVPAGCIEWNDLAKLEAAVPPKK